MSFTSGFLRHVAALLACAAASGGAGAHTYALGIGASEQALHYFGVICSNEGGYDTDHLLLQIRNDTPGAPLLSAQVIKGTLAQHTTDPQSGDAQASPTLRVRGGNGLYQVLVNKGGPGAAAFTIVVHCLDASGTQHTGTDAVVYQYQDR